MGSEAIYPDYVVVQICDKGGSVIASAQHRIKPCPHLPSRLKTIAIKEAENLADTVFNVYEFERMVSRNMFGGEGRPDG